MARSAAREPAQAQGTKSEDALLDEIQTARQSIAQLRHLLTIFVGQDAKAVAHCDGIEKDMPQLIQAVLTQGLAERVKKVRSVEQARKLLRGGG